MKLLLRTLLTILTLAGCALAAGEVDVPAKLNQAHDLVAQSLRHYRAGDLDAAFRSARSAYLDHFEYAEPPLRILDPDLILETEFAFGRLRHGMDSGLPLSSLEPVASEIYQALDRAETLITGTGALAPTIAATTSFILLFREGLEVVLLLAAILSYLQATRATRLVPGVWYGLVASLMATALTWFVATYLIAIAPVSRELIAGISSVVAVVLLAYLSFWMLAQSDRRRHMEYMQARLARAVQRGSLLAVALASFAVSYREGFETVLLYQALAAVSGPVMSWVWLGVAAALIALALVALAVIKLRRRLPLRVFFRVAVAITALLAVAFSGNAVRALQEAGLVPVHNLLGSLPRLGPNLSALTGYHPTSETLLAQAALAGFYLLGFGWLWLRGRRRTGASESTQPG